MDYRQLHQQAIIYDGHNDSLMLKLERGGPLDFGPPNPEYHVDLPRLQSSGLTAFNNCVGARDLPISLEVWEALYWHLDTYPDRFLLARTAADIRRAKLESKLALVGQLESCACLGGTPRSLAPAAPSRPARGQSLPRGGSGTTRARPADRQ